MKGFYLLAGWMLTSAAAFAQRGFDGSKTIASTTTVNEYVAITANAAAGSTSISVSSSTLNANARFANNLAPGDLIMLYQAQGATIRGSAQVASTTDTSWGRLDAANYASTGRYELCQVRAVPNATTIQVDCPTKYSYVAAGKAMVIRVPRYSSLTINSGGILTCDDWNGAIGGVLAVEVLGNVVVNTGGSIVATGKGFRGGSLVGDNSTSFGASNTYSTSSAIGAEKGESVAGYQAEYDTYGGRYGRGAPANGGGGGCGHNAGGGGGANGPNGTSTTAVWRGCGIPDQSVAGWSTAWNLEPPANTMTTLTATNSAGGGRGGYTYSSSNQNATTVAPGNAAWGGDSRSYLATGLGGRPLDYSDGRLFLGGGGGAGDQNNSGGGIGGDGGGLIYLRVFGAVSGSGSMVSNGSNGGNGQGGTGVITGIEAGGGGGAGGTILLNASGSIASTLALHASGGNGGNQVINLPFSTNEGEGPGGGGGGGYIAVSSGTPTRTANGGNNGTTNSAAVTEFTPNGATKGCPGTNNAAISDFSFTSTDATICSGAATTLTASGTLPSGTSFNWYAAETGGAALSGGSSYTTPALTSTTTYYLGTCPGSYRIPVVVTVNPAGTWTGAGGSDWNTPANWCTGAVPTALTDVVIPAIGSVPAMPIVFNGSTAHARNISILGTLGVASGGTLNIYGDVSTGASGAFSANGGTVNLSGGSPQNIAPGFTAANLNISNGSTKTLTNGATITNNLALTNGVLNVLSPLILGTASITGGSAGSYVQTSAAGSALSRQVGSASVVFPVGRGSYNPASISNAGTGDIFSVRVRDEVLSEGTSGTPVNATTTYAINHTWDISEAAPGGSNATVTLQWGSVAESNNPAAFQQNHVYVAHYYGGQWNHDDIAFTYQAPAAGGFGGPGPFTATDLNVTSFSPFTVGSAGGSSPLPVTLSRFAAYHRADENIIEWNSETETDILHYEVEASPDGLRFDRLAVVPATGSASSYLVRDRDPAAGLHYYRLTMVNADGSLTYSAVVQVFVAGQGTLVLQAQPNPVGDQLHIAVFGAADGRINLMDALGRVVKSTRLENGRASLPTADLPAGVYLLKYNHQGEERTLRLLK